MGPAGEAASAAGPAPRRVAVFLGASKGTSPAFQRAAEAVGPALAAKGLELVYGGGNVGLMGLMAESARKAGVPVTGVIPEALVPREVSGDVHEAIATVVTKDMHERKATMAALADAFVALPGGFGTLEETIEMITWQQLGYHSKPVGLLNVDGFYDSLLRFFDDCVDTGFIRAESRGRVLCSADLDDLLSQLETYVAPESVTSLAKRGALSEEQRG